MYPQNDAHTSEDILTKMIKTFPLTLNFFWSSVTCAVYMNTQIDCYLTMWKSCRLVYKVLNVGLADDKMAKISQDVQTFIAQNLPKYCFQTLGLLGYIPSTFVCPLS